MISVDPTVGSTVSVILVVLVGVGVYVDVAFCGLVADGLGVSVVV